MNRWTAFFLVLLRVAIGWHFLVEGLDKLSQPAWTSAGYLREASGPLAPYFADVAGDPVLDKMTVVPAADDKLSRRGRLSPALLQEWEEYLDAFDAHYRLDDNQGSAETLGASTTALLASPTNPAGLTAVVGLFPGRTNQRDLARFHLLEHEDQLAWLLLDPDTKKPFPVSPAGAPAVLGTMQQRLDDYRNKLKAARGLPVKEMSMFGKGAEAALLSAKADARKTGADLQKELDAETQAMKDALKSVLTPAQLNKPALREPLPVPLAHWSYLQWSDAAVKWGLTIFGACLILGFFARTAAVGGATLLLMFYLSMPSLPGLPESPKSEGHYLYINKNIIEMLALLALATTASGRWVGLDGLVHALNPFRRRSVRPAPNPPKVAPAPVPTVAVSTFVAPTEEQPHGS